MANWVVNTMVGIAPSEKDARWLASVVTNDANYEVQRQHLGLDPYSPILGGPALKSLGIEGNHITITSDSRNEPPLELYKALEALGWSVGAVYWEPNDTYWGLYRYGVDNRVDYEWSEDLIEPIEPSDGNWQLDLVSPPSEFYEALEDLKKGFQ